MTNFQTWLDRSKYDLDTAKDLLSVKKNDYAIFFCHQALEKALKGLFLFETAKMPPYIHNLIKISKLSSAWNDMDEEEKDFLEELNPYYIELRYPAEEQLEFENISDEKSLQFYHLSEKIIKWLEVKMTLSK